MNTFESFMLFLRRLCYLIAFMTLPMRINSGLAIPSPSFVPAKDPETQVMHRLEEVEVDPKVVVPPLQPI